jgi:hypothetical protein
VKKNNEEKKILTDFWNIADRLDDYGKRGLDVGEQNETQMQNQHIRLIYCS